MTPQDLLSALDDLEDYGTARAGANGTVTIPAQARSDLRLPSDAHWQILGSPKLGVAIVVGRPEQPGETLRMLLEAD